MSVVTSVGGVSAWHMRGSSAGLVAGVGVGSLFLLGGLQIAGSNLFDRETPTGPSIPAVKSHEMGHQASEGAPATAPSCICSKTDILHFVLPLQLCLIGSLMFAGAMSYRAGSNPYSGPGGAMLASLGAISGA